MGGLSRGSGGRRPARTVLPVLVVLVALSMMLVTACGGPPAPGSVATGAPAAGHDTAAGPATTADPTTAADHATSPDRATEPGSLTPGPPRPVDGQYLFTLMAPQARSVSVAGTFNGWVPTSNQLERQGDLWFGWVKVPLGRHKYRFLIDGTRWVLDPDNPRQAKDSLGALASLLVVTK